jgi:hypothetical protein
MADLNYERDVSIDPDALDVEWLRQPMNYMTYAQEAARLDAIMKNAKEAMEVLYAQLDRDTRRSSDKKLTEAQVEAAVLTDSRYQEAQATFSDATYEYNICIAAVKAMDHKRAALENLVKLYQGSYFAGPREPRNLTDEYNKKGFQQMGEDRTRDQIRSRMHRRERH